MSTSETVSLDHQQTNVMGNLALLRYLCTLTPSPFLTPNEAMKNDKMTRILNWVAASFVREAEGDAVAAALVTSHPGIKLYIAANRGKSEPQDMKNVDAFLTVLRKAMRTYQDDDIDTATFLLFEHATITSISHIEREMENITTMVNERPQIPQTLGAADSQKGGDIFETLVKAWAESPDLPKQDPLLAGVFEDIYNTGAESGPGDMLLKVFHDLIAACDDMFPPHACLYAEAMACSRFFKALPSSHIALDIPKLGLEWLLRLNRRIRHVAHYLADAQLLVTEGFKMFMRTLGPDLQDFLAGGPGISIEWVGDIAELPAQHGVPFQWPFSAKNRLEQFLSARLPDVSLSTDGSTLDSQVFQTGDTVVPHLHCELQLIRYLKENNIQVHGMAIGVSKLPCFGCAAYVFASHNDMWSFYPHWKFPGFSNKFHHGWLMPAEHGEEIVKMVEDTLEDILRRLADSRVFVQGGTEYEKEKAEKEDDFKTILKVAVLLKGRSDRVSGS